MPNIASVVLAAIGVIAPMNAMCAELRGLDFVVTTDKKVYTIGEPVRVTFAWTNVTDRTLVIVNWRGPLGGISDISEGVKAYDFEVLYDGQEMLKYHGEFVDGLRTSLDLEPKKSLTRAYDISDVYDFGRPGRYVIRATYCGFAYDDPAPGRWRGKITHPDVELWVRQ
jgi:hypothetical protein